MKESDREATWPAYYAAFHDKQEGSFYAPPCGNQLLLARYVQPDLFTVYNTIQELTFVIWHTEYKFWLESNNSGLDILPEVYAGMGRRIVLPIRKFSMIDKDDFDGVRVLFHELLLNGGGE